MSKQFIRIKQVQEKVPLSRSTIWRMEKVGKFPRRKQLSSNSVAWDAEEIAQWIATRCAQDIGNGK